MIYIRDAALWRSLGFEFLFFFCYPSLRAKSVIPERDSGNLMCGGREQRPDEINVSNNRMYAFETGMMGRYLSCFVKVNYYCWRTALFTCLCAFEFSNARD